MTKLTPTEFFTRAIERVPFRNTRNPRYHHLGLRLNILKEPFARYYGDELNLTEVLDTLIKQRVVVAARMVWAKGQRRGKLKTKEVKRLKAFPDPLIADDNPILYLPTAIPRILKTRLNRSEEILDMILRPTLVVANG